MTTFKVTPCPMCGNSDIEKLTMSFKCINGHGKARYECEVCSHYWEDNNGEIWHKYKGKMLTVEEWKQEIQADFSMIETKIEFKISLKPEEKKLLEDMGKTDLFEENKANEDLEKVEETEEEY